MNDCSNVEIRDRLPDLLHDRLAISMREVVVAHVADCVDCREELDVLRGLHRVLSVQTPRVDVARIVAALPKPPVAGVAVGPATRVARHRARIDWRIDWRIAAAVTFLAVGGSSIAILEQTPSANRSIVDSGLIAPVSNAAIGSQRVAHSVTVPATPSSGAKQGVGGGSATASQTVAAVTPPAGSAAAAAAAADAEAAEDVRPGGRFAGLTEEQLKSLLGDIGQLPAVPVTEPDPVSIQLNSGSTIPDGR